MTGRCPIYSSSRQFVNHGRHLAVRATQRCTIVSRNVGFFDPGGGCVVTGCALLMVTGVWGVSVCGAK